MTAFADFIRQPFHGQRYIAHCYDEIPRAPLSHSYTSNQNALILIGPEGDFSREEVEAAIAAGFTSVSLGKSRLRTETAALVACQTIHLINEIEAVK
jgi:16S rRNA (uracil1498-N3)-methyltransferase